MTSEVSDSTTTDEASEGSVSDLPSLLRDIRLFGDVNLGSMEYDESVTLFL